MTTTRRSYLILFSLKAALTAIILLFAVSQYSFGDTVVTPATGGNSLCVGGGYVTLGDITVKEQLHDDFNAQTNKNFVLVIPSANFEFRPGVGSVQLISGSLGQLMLTNPIVVTATSVTINFQLVGANNNLDGFIISGIQVRAVGAADAGQILVKNPAQPNDTDLKKNRAGDNVNHGLLVSVLPNSTAPVLTSSDADNTICAGEAVTFTASPIAGASYYEFFINNVSSFISTSTVFSTNTLTNGQSVTVRGLVSNGCSSALSSAITTTVISSPAISLTSNDPDNSICSGQSVTFTASPAGLSNYVFFVNGASVYTGPSHTYTTSLLTNGQTVSVRATASGNCTATSTGISIQVNAVPAITLSSSDADNMICAGESITYTANSPTATSFEFFVNNVSKQHSTLKTFTSDKAAHGDVISVVASTNQGCSATATGSTLTVFPSPSVTLVSSDDNNSICAGESVTFSAVSSGASTFEFFINGTSVKNSPDDFYTTSSLTNGETVTARAISLNSCSTISNSITTIVRKQPSILLSSSDADNKICAGEKVTFTATSDIGVSYEFLLNGVSVQNGNANTYSNSTLTNGQQVAVRVSSGDGCTTTSLPITTSVSALPAISFSSSDIDNIICAGETVLFSATQVPSATYRFMINGTVVLSGPLHQYSTQLLNDGDEVKVIVVTADNCEVSSQSIITRVNLQPLVTLSSSDADNTICAGEAVTFTAASAIASVYTFMINGTIIQNSNSNTFTTSSLANGQTVSVRVTTASGCTDLSSGITMAVNPIPARPVLSIITGTAVFCQQDASSVTLQSSSPTGNQWFKDGILLSGETSQNIILSAVSHSGTYTIKSTGPGSCQSTASDPLTITIFPSPLANLAVSANSQVCEGNAANINIAGSQAGINYSLYNGSTLLNGPVGGTGSTISLSTGTLSPGNYTLTIKATNPSSGCNIELNNTASITVNPLPAITLSSSNGNDPVCPGETVTFTANSATAVNYEFFVDGISRQSGTSHLFTTSSLINNQAVSVVATSAANCKKSSNSILVNVNPLIVTLSSSDSDNIKCAGEPVTFTASANLSTVSNYEFFINGMPVQNGPSASYTTSLLTNGQTVTVKATTASSCSAISNGITTLVYSLPVITLYSSDTDNKICRGEAVTFTANAPTATTYEFFVNGVSVQNSATNLYTSAALTNGQTVTVRATTASGCSDLSTGITTTVNDLPAVTLSSSDADNIICAGEQVTFTASSATAVNYEFFVDGISRQNSTSHQFITNSLNNGQSVSVIVRDSNGCSSASNIITFNVYPLPVIILTSNDADNTICPGEPVTFTASANLSTVSNYEFFINGMPVQNGPSASYTTSLLTNGQTVTVKATTASSCSAISNGIMTFVNILTATLSSSDTDNKICRGEAVTFTANAPTATTYEFFVNGVSVQNSATNLYTSAALTNGQTVTVRATTASGCSDLSTGITTTVNDLPAVTLSSSDADNIICAGEQVTFTASSATAVNYEFFVDGISRQNSTSHQFITNSLNNGQSVSVIVTTSAGCSAISNNIKNTVNNKPLITLSSSDDDDTICPGEIVTFTAFSASATIFDFFTDGVLVQQSASNIYKTGTLSNGQTVTVKATTASGCSATSSGISTAVINFSVSLSSSDADNIICPGEQITFKATSTASASFEFFINGTSVQSGTADSYTTTTLTNGQTVTVRAVSASCSLISNMITTTVEALTVNLKSSDPDNKICPGETVTFTANSATALTYEFFVDGISRQNSTSNQYLISDLTDGQTVWVIAQTASGCIATSNSISTFVESISVSLTSSDADNSICQGESVTFTASSATAVNYEFFVNGVSVQNSATNLYTSATLTNGQTVTVKIRNAYGCSTLSTGITTIVNPLSTVTLISSDKDNIICRGETVTFTAISAIASDFNFLVNGVSMQAGLANTYTTSSLTNGQVVTVRVTTASGCSTLSSGIATTVNDLPAVTLSSSDADNSICQGESVTFTASSATAVNYEFFVNGVSVQNSATNLYTSAALTNGQTVRVRATTASICSALSAGITTTVNALPTVTLSSSDADNTICAGESVTFTASSATAVNYEFFVNGVSVQNSATNLYTSAALTNGQTVRVRVTTASGCSTLSSGIATTVNDLPAVTLSSSDADNSICQGESVTFTASSATAVNYEFFVNGVSVQNSATNQYTTNVLNNGEIIRVIVTTAASCQIVSNSIGLTVNALPAVTLSSSDADNSICQGESVTFTASSATAVNYEFFVNGVSVQNSATNLYTSSALTNGQTVRVRVTTASGCSTLSSGIATTVNDLPAVTLSSSDADNSICAGESVTFTASSATAVNYEFFVNGVSVQNSATNLYTSSALTNGQTVRVRVTTASGCSTLSSGIATTVNDLPAVTLSSSDADNSICAGESVTFTASSATAVNYEFFVNGVSVQNSATNQYTSATLTNGQTVRVRVTTASGCSTLSSGIATTVNDLPAVTLSSSDADNSICQGESVTFTASSATAVNYEFFVNGVSVQNSATNLYTSATLTNGQTVTVRATTASICSALSAGITTTVNALPTVTLSSSDADNTICAGESVTFTASSATAVNYEFFVNGVSVQNSATNLYTSATLTNGQTVTVRATTASICSALSAGIATTVNALPAVTLSSSDADNTICAGESVTFTASSATAVNYEFFINDVRVQNSASNKYITTSLINGQKASVRVTTASGCSTLSAEIINLVNPKVTVNAGTDQTVCEATQVTLSGSATVEDKPIAVTWSGGAGTFSNVHDLNATYTPAPGETGKTIILTLTTADPDENGPCSEAADQVRITINMLPAVLFSGLNLRYCVDASTTELTGFPAGGTFTGPGISKGASGQDLFTPNLAGVGSHVIRYTYTNANSCTNYFERTVIVHPLPSVSFTGFNKEGAGATSQYAQDAPTISLTGLPAGGAFTGEGISGNTFSASAAGPGTHTIRYTYGDANGCINFQEQIVTVLPLPEVGIGNMPAYFCSRDQDYLLTGTPAGGTFSGPGIIAGTTVFRPSNAFIGSNIIRYTYKDPVSGGTNFIEKTVVVYKVPDVTFSGLNAAYCVDAPAALLNGFPADNDGPGGVLGVFKGEGIYLDETQGNYLFIPSVAGIGTHRITYIFTNENGCTDSTSKQVIVNDLPMVTFNGLDNAYCLDAPSVRLFGFPSGGTFSGPGISSNNFIPSLAGTGTHTISYTFTNSNGCTSIQQQQVVINPVPVASFQYADVCDKNQVMFTDLTATSETGSIQDWEWNFGDPVSGTSNTSTLQNPTHMFTAPGTYNVSLKVISEYGCVNTRSLSVTIGGIPDPDFTWSAICLGEDAIFNHGTSVSVGTITKWHWNFGDNTEKEFNNSSDPVSHQYASAGRYNVTLTVTTNFGCTNSITKEVYILPAVNTYPYFENFENNDGGWIEDGFLSSWQYGTPASNTIKQAASGSHAWITGLTSGYNANEKSFVYSPCFDFSSLRKPMISLNIWNHNQQGFDGVVLQSSVNGGLTWINVGAIGEGINWYNQSAIIGNPGNQQIGQNGWSGTDSVWHNAKYALDHLKGLSSVRFRIAFGSNNDNPPNQILDGFAFDDVYVGERDRTVVLEHFTNAANPEAAEEDNFINHLSQDTDEVISIHYHTNFPGYDPMNADNQADPSARTLFYGIPQTPRTAIDGHTVNQKFSSWGLPVLSRRKLTETAFSIDVDFPQTADQALNIQANIKALLHITDTLTVHIVVVEKQTSNLSGNGIVYKNVLRKMLPNAAGTRFTKIWLPGETQSINQSWQVVNVQDAAQLAVIVFIQNDRTKEIYQATIKQPTILPAVITGIEAQGAETRSFVLYPNPASQQATLAFGQPISQEYAWSVYDMLGRKVDQGIMQKGQHTLLLNTATYVEGSYVIHINGRNKISYHKKLVIIHNK